MPFGLDKLEQERTPAAHPVAEHQPGNKRRDKPVAPDNLGGGKRKQRQTEYRCAFGAWAHPFEFARAINQPGTTPANDQPDDGTQNELRRNERNEGNPRRLAGTGTGERGKQQHDRQCNTVVETAFDIERLADTHRHLQASG